MVFERKVYCILGLPFDAIDSDCAVNLLKMAAAERRRLFLSTPNLNFLIGCLNDQQFRDSVIQSDLSVADGMPLVWIAKILGIPIKERIAGSILFKTLREKNNKQLSVYFFGGPDGVAADACRKLCAENKGLTCVGYCSPGFGSIKDMSSEDIISRINDSNADFVVVSLGAKKGQSWIINNRNRLKAPIVSHLGAVVNFVSGRVKQAPGLISRLGLEWLWRIKEEPLLWYRYFKDGVALIHIFLFRVLPYLWFMHHQRPNPDDLNNSFVSIIEGTESCIIKLEGALTHGNIILLRKAFPNALSSGKNIELDMARVSYIDSSVVGLILLLYGQLKGIDKRFQISNPSPSVVKVFKLSCVEYLLQKADSTSKCNFDYP